MCGYVRNQSLDKNIRNPLLFGPMLSLHFPSYD